MNWETAEVQRWYNNDQGLYNVLQNILESEENDYMASLDLEAHAVRFQFPGVNIWLVDFEAIIKEERE